jgi:hypothetical protein
MERTPYNPVIIILMLPLIEILVTIEGHKQPLLLTK